MKSLKIILRPALLLVTLILLAACGNSQPNAAVSGSGEKLKVVATFSILGDLAQNVGGDKIELHTLVGPGGDTHTFEPSPQDSVALVEAKLIFENGLGLETWLDRLYTASGSQGKRVTVTEGLELITLAPAKGKAAGASEEHGHGEFDPHVWHNVTNVIREVETIRAALATADPANAKSYQANAETYLGRLQELESWVAEEIKKIPADRRKLVTSHDTFGYLARRYSLEVVGSGLGSISTETGDPSAAEVVKLIEEIKGAGVPAIFTENVANPKLMERVAAEAGVTLGPQLYSDALGQPGSAGDTYLKMMRYNVTTLVTALSQ